MNREPFGRVDPEFGLDIGFYVFELPVFTAVIGFVSTILILSAITATLTGFLYGAISLNGRELRISRTMRIQLGILGVLYFLIQAANLWLQQYDTLVSRGGASCHLVPASPKSAPRFLPEPSWPV